MAGNGCSRRGGDVLSRCVSAVAIVSVAAVCAGYLWFERHQVQRAARVRFLERRRCGAMRWCAPGPAASTAEVLERRIEDAVRCADVALAYYERLFPQGAPRESPFQLRRARVDAAQRRFAAAATGLQGAVSDWLEDLEVRQPDDQSCLAVGRVQAWLLDHPVPTRFPVGPDAGTAEATVDVLENALANLRRRRVAAPGAGPFRGLGHCAALGQDVTTPSVTVPLRHADGSRAAASP